MTYLQYISKLNNTQTVLQGEVYAKQVLAC